MLTNHPLEPITPAEQAAWEQSWDKIMKEGIASYRTRITNLEKEVLRLTKELSMLRNQNLTKEF